MKKRIVVSVVIVGIVISVISSIVLRPRGLHYAAQKTLRHFDASMVDSGFIPVSLRNFDRLYYKVYSLKEDEFYNATYQLSETLFLPEETRGLDVSIYGQIIDTEIVLNFEERFTTLSAPFTYVFFVN